MTQAPSYVTYIGISPHKYTLSILGIWHTLCILETYLVLLHIYKNVEKDGLVNVEMIKQEIEEDRLDKNNELEEEIHNRI